MTTEINLGNLVIPIIKPEKGKDYYTETEKQELISIVTDNVNSVVLPQEQTRQENEATRQSNEETRQSQENTRQSNEVSRQTAESARVEAENLRQSNESSRISAEQTRVETFNTQMQAVDTAIGGIHTSQDAYDQNAQAKTEAFNTNATNKMNAYNENASEKIDEYDQHVHDYETELANKVDKVQGKDLSTNDYDNTEKGKVSANTEARHTHSNKSVLDGTTASYTTEKDQKLDGLENYDDTELREDIEQNTTNIEELKQENEDLKKNQLTNTPEKATSHYLQDSADSRFRKFIPIGRTTQESTTGKNLLNVSKEYEVIGYNTIPIDLMADEDYIISASKIITEGSTNTMLIGLQNEDNTITYIYSYGINNLVLPFKPDKNIKNILLYSQNSYSASKEVKTTFYNLMIRLASITDDTYEPYTGGEPAPNPNYPFPIKNTGDNGSVNEKVSNSDGTQEQNISFPLAQGQKLYQDEELKENGKDDMFGELVFTGIENYDWKKSTTYDGSYYFYPNNYELDYKEYSEFKCSHAICVKSSLNYKIGKCFAESAINLWLGDGTQLPTPTAFKAYLAEQYANGTPVTVVYKKAEPTITPYTEGQQQYYDEHIKPLRTYKNVTHISSEDETPANVEITYVRDLETVINNLTTRVETIESEV